VLKRWMSHGSKEVLSEGIGGLAVVIPREMSALVHEVLGLKCEGTAHVLGVVTPPLCKRYTFVA